MANEVNTYLQTLTTVTASGNGTALVLPASGGPRRGYVWKAYVNNVGGTAPTLALKIQLSRDGGTTWLDYSFFVNHKSATTNTITLSGEYYTYLHDVDIFDPAGVYPHQIRLVYTVGGSAGQTFDLEVAEVVGVPG